VQQGRRKTALHGKLHSLAECRFGAGTQRIGRRKQQLPVRHALAAGIDPGPRALLVAGKGRHPDAGLGEGNGLRIVDQSGARPRQSFGDRRFDALVASAFQKRRDRLRANLDGGRNLECREQPRPQRRRRLSGFGQSLRRLAIGAGEIFAGDDVERRGPLGRGHAELGRRGLVAGEEKEQRGLCLGGERRRGPLFRKAEKEIVHDAHAFWNGGLPLPQHGSGEGTLGPPFAGKLKGELGSRCVSSRCGTEGGDEQRLPPGWVGPAPLKGFAEINVAGLVNSPQRQQSQCVAAEQAGIVGPGTAKKLGCFASAPGPFQSGNPDQDLLAARRIAGGEGAGDEARQHGRRQRRGGKQLLEFAHVDAAPKIVR
jgi:hypothetical protein